MKRIISFIVILVLMMSFVGTYVFAAEPVTKNLSGDMTYPYFLDAIHGLPDNSTVVLNDGTYQIILGGDHTDGRPMVYPKNLTIKAGSGAYVSTFQANGVASGYVLSGLSIGGVQLGGPVNGFTVDGCVGGSFTASGSDINNITIKNSTLTASNGNAIAINGSSTNVNITNNNITASAIGIILNNDINGNVNISGNNISGTGDRAIRLVNVYGTVNISNNSINNCAVADVPGEGLFKVTQTGAGGAVNFSGNTYAAKTWQPANVGANSSGGATYLLSDNTVCTVSFNSNGGSAVTPVVVTKGGTIAALPSAIKDGYTLLGWFTAAEGGEAITAATVFNADTTVYAHWATVNDNPYGVPSTGSERDTALMIVLAALSGSVLLYSLRRKREA